MNDPLILFMAILFGFMFLMLGVDVFGLQSFWPSLFRSGVPVYEHVLPLSMPDMPPGSVFETQSGRFKVVGPRECFFYRKDIVMFKDGKWNLSGCLLWTGDHALAQGRIPATSIAWNAGWMVFMGVGLAVALALPLRNWTIGVSVSLLVFSLLSFILYQRALKTKDTIHRILVEYEAYMAQRREGNPTHVPTREATR